MKTLKEGVCSKTTATNIINEAIRQIDQERGINFLMQETPNAEALGIRFQLADGRFIALIVGGGEPT